MMIPNRTTAAILACLTMLSVFAGPFLTVGSREGISAPARAGPVTFTNVSEEVGLSDIRGNFFSWGDHDKDGDQDLLIDGKRLMVNSGPPSYRFIDQTLQAGISSSSNSGVFGDYDNDGFLDIFCGGGKGSSDHPEHPDILWHNERDGTFRKITGKGAPGDTFPTVASGWSDIDRDGFLDLYMVNYEDGSFEGYPDHFWMNDGDGTFTNATETSGMSEYDHPYQGRGVSFCDMDNDGFQDAYVSNYRIMPNYLYRNLKNGTFDESAESSGVEGHGNLHPVTREGPYYGHSLGSSWGDLDNDGYMDLWVTNLAHKDIYRGPICDDSYLFRNLGPEQDYSFEDVRGSSGIDVKPLGGTVTEGDELMVSSSLADYDNDGDLDLFIPQIYNDIEYASSFLYQNQGDMTFTEVGEQAGIRVWNTYGSAWCDYNNDGWMDLVTGGGVWSEGDGSTQGQMVHLFRNNGNLDSPSNNWIKVSLHGRESNSAAIGARVTVTVDRNGDGEGDLSMIRDVNGGTAAHGQQDSMILHFGLGQQVESVDVKVDWPLGRTTLMDDVSSGNTLEVYETTDPIELTLDLVSLENDNGNAGMEMTITNPSDHDIDTGWVGLSYIYEDHVLEDSFEFRDLSAGMRFTVRNSSSLIPYEGLIRVEARIDRTFPPVSSSLTDEISVRSMTEEDPVAVLEAASTAIEGEDITISGEGSFVPNGTIDQYKFDFGDGTGTGWTVRSVVTHSYSRPGNYTITLDVMDNDGSVSGEPAEISILIREGEIPPPAARIIDIDPTLAEEGEEISFAGEGIAHGDRRVVEYEWTSSIDGIMSRRSSFIDDDLTAGVHMVSFRVKDSEGIWSDPDTMEIEITGEIHEATWVSIDPLDIEGPFKVPVMLSGRAGPAGEVHRVEVRIDSGPWSEARGTVEWEYLIEIEDLDPDRDHVVQVRAMANGEYSDVEDLGFSVEPGSKAVDTGPENDEESFANISSWTIIIPMVMVALVAVSLLAFTMMRRKRKDTLRTGVAAIEMD